MEGNRIQDINLALLTAYLLKKNWKVNLNIKVLIDYEDHRDEAETNMKYLFELARLPKDAVTHFFTGQLDDILKAGERSDLNITYIYPENIDMAKLREKSIVTEASFLYTLNSGNENALA